MICTSGLDSTPQRCLEMPADQRFHHSVIEANSIILSSAMGSSSERLPEIELDQVFSIGTAGARFDAVCVYSPFIQGNRSIPIVS